MKRPPVIVRVIVVLVIVSAVAYWFLVVRQSEVDSRLIASGTIEVQEVTIAPEQGGRVAEVLAAVGESVTARQPLVRFDTTLLEGQLAQAQAQLAVAQANYNLAAAGATEAQLKAGETAVARAQTQLDAINEQLAAAEGQRADVEAQISELRAQILALTAAVQEAQATQQATNRAELSAVAVEAQTQLVPLNGQLAMAQQLETAVSNQIQLLTSQISVAEAGVDAAQAQLDVLLAGPRPEQLAVTQAQVEAAQAGINLLQTQMERQTLTAPLAGVVLVRTIEPGEVAAPGAALLVLGQLQNLTITVYVPEDRYGRIAVGQTAVIRVDSFPNETFMGTVRRIADQAEFTPRNVQTAAGRASTVFAIELTVQDSAGKLKPGMPADVDFGE